MLMRQMADSEKMPVLPDKWPILYSLFGWYSLRARVASQLLLLPRTRRTFLLASHIFTCSPIFVSSNFSPCWGSSPQTPAKGTKSLWNPYVYKQFHINRGFHGFSHESPLPGFCCRFLVEHGPMQGSRPIGRLPSRIQIRPSVVTDAVRTD